MPEIIPVLTVEIIVRSDGTAIVNTVDKQGGATAYIEVNRFTDVYKAVDSLLDEYYHASFGNMVGDVWEGRQVWPFSPEEIYPLPEARLRPDLFAIPKKKEVVETVVRNHCPVCNFLLEISEDATTVHCSSAYTECRIGQMERFISEARLCPSCEEVRHLETKWFKEPETEKACFKCGAVSRCADWKPTGRYFFLVPPMRPSGNIVLPLQPPGNFERIELILHRPEVRNEADFVQGDLFKEASEDA